MESLMLENQTVVKMIQSVVCQTIYEKVQKDKEYLNDCPMDEFVKVSEMIKDDDEPNFKIVKAILSNTIYREDLLPVSDLVLCNLAYFFSKFESEDYKYHTFYLDLLIGQFKKEISIFNLFLLKYILELIKKNLIKFHPDAKSEILELVL